MAKPKATVQGLVSILQIQGLASTQELLERLRISRATLGRLVRQAGESVVRFGQTNQTRYGSPKNLASIGSQQPVFRVSEAGKLQPIGKIVFLHSSNYALVPVEGADLETYPGLPPEIGDMRPQGFMGRAFARQYANELGVPERLSDWSNDQILIALGRRGDDLPGNLILGHESAARWRDQTIRPVARADYPSMLRAAIESHPPGSAAGGEQAKFSAFDGKEHWIVKFAGTDSSAAQSRWKDLLLCESIALDILQNAGIPAARAQIQFSRGQHAGPLFLEVARFDRMEQRGRRATVTLAAISDFYYGSREPWSAEAERLERDERISPQDALLMKVLDSFGAWIADTDRHPHNIAFFPENSGSGLLPQKFRLAPAFDKLPMFYAPVAGEAVARLYPLPIPRADQLEVWQRSKELGLAFWKKASNDPRISADFQAIARAHVSGIEES